MEEYEKMERDVERLMKERAAKEQEIKTLKSFDFQSSRYIVR